MNERIRIILTLLLKKPEIKMAELSKELNLTRRQINYAINQFNEELELMGLPKIERTYVGDFNVPLEVLKLLASDDIGKQHDNWNFIDNSLSESERVSLIIVFIINHTEYVSLNHLTDVINVSKNTVMEDMKKVGWLTSKYDLSLDYNRDQGYQIKGNEHRLLQLLSDLVRQNKILKDELYKELLAPQVTDKEILYLINSMEQMLHLSYSDDSLDYLQSVLRFVLQRNKSLKNNDRVFFEGDINKHPEYKFLKVLLQEGDWKVSQSYTKWIALLFLSSNIFERNTTQDYESDEELKNLIQEMVNKFQLQTLINIDNRDVFERRILSHLRPACFRIKYNLSLGTYSLNNMKQGSNHAILNELMKELILPIENWLEKAFPYDELELLSYYFGFQLTSPIGADQQKPRGVVVCTNGVIVSKLMRENLKKLFPEIHFLSAFSVRDFYKFGQDFDVVFTTTPLNSSATQLIIEPIMTYKEQINLRYRVLSELGINDVDNSADELLKIIKTHSQIKEETQLKEELAYYLLSKKQDSPLENFKTLPSLTQYLKPNFIKIIEYELTWEDAVRLASQPLLDHQIINESFINDSIMQIKEADYTGYLGTKTCIPHTTVENGVLRDGVSLLISKKPIVFPNNHLMNFIIPLSFYDLTKHLRAVNQIADISNDLDLLETLLKATDEKTAYQIIRHNT
ncbi:PTS sugar transporter subunit IIA [Vagococcus carniphilus]|uniref:BglG family transcription antiterminator n=1 Tax=Vagococcus carniphilus TaxID=218144 RepID=UPI0028919D03|nr:PTS sugar transporter subunit IIA [Vagococcus carniphilus]MDT2849034.1 PTS sugar transporter subunit IIA [Vagococcus carniphilus]